MIGRVKGRDCVGKNITVKEFHRQFALKSIQHETDDLSIILRRIGRGVCIKSFPIDSFSAHLIEIVMLCQDSDRNLIHLPYEGGLYDQPALFFHARTVINDEIARLQVEDEHKNGP